MEMLCRFESCCPFFEERGLTGIGGEESIMRFAKISDSIPCSRGSQVGGSNPPALHKTNKAATAIILDKTFNLNPKLPCITINMPYQCRKICRRKDGVKHEFYESSKKNSE